MTPMPRHGRRDSNEGEIVTALQQVGATVWRLDTPVDILAGYQGRTYLLDVKTKSGKPTKLQRDFIEAWRGGPDGKVGNPDYVQTVGNFPRSVLYFDAITQNHLHPTQKPVALFAYLIRTYTQPGDIVFDPCCGSGTTAVSARAEGRHYIVGDSSAHYCDVTRDRLRLPFTGRAVKAENDVSGLPIFEVQS